MLSLLIVRAQHCVLENLNLNVKILLFVDIIWILGRERDLTATSRAELYNLLYELNINPDRLILSKHEKCEEFF